MGSGTFLYEEGKSPFSCKGAQLICGTQDHTNSQPTLETLGYFKVRQAVLQTLAGAALTIIRTLVNNQIWHSAFCSLELSEDLHRTVSDEGVEQNIVDEHYLVLHGTVSLCVHLHLKSELKIRLLETFNLYLIMRI